MNRMILDMIVLAVLLLVIDSVYLNIVAKPIYEKTVLAVQKSPMTIRLAPGAMVYLLMVIVLYRFIIAEKKTPVDAFILGICVYGVFDFTSMAIFKNYNLLTAVVDTVWGGILFFIATFAMYKIQRYF